ncbi:MAG: AraC family transcriptional regulator [Defluviitaleaceae bacterium]|nr:AraC family transcriptional regulator [Defluviitaleaceae bacterium]
MESLLFFLERIYRMTSIPIRYIGNNTNLFSRGYETKPDPFEHDPMIIENLKNKCFGSSRPFLEFEDEIFLYGGLRDNSGNQIYVGPVVLGEVDSLRIREYGQKHNINSNIFVKSSNLIRVSSVIEAIHFVCNGGLLTDSNIVTELSETLQKLSANVSLQTNLLDNSENEMHRFGYTEERLFMQRVREGDCEGIKALNISRDAASSLSFVSENTGRVAGSKFKQFEYIACSIITLASRAAIEGGMDALSAYTLSDVYFQHLEKIKTIPDVLELIKEVQLDYAARVRKILDIRKRSSYVEKSKSYIDGNLSKQFSLDDISRSIGISRSHLSRLFSQVEGMGVMDYARIKRIEVAANLLSYSNQSIYEIAMSLCFPSQSYFGAVFKKFMGITPRQYREKQSLTDINPAKF